MIRGKDYHAQNQRQDNGLHDHYQGQDDYQIKYCKFGIKNLTKISLCQAHPKYFGTYFLFDSLWDKALAAILLVLALERPSCNAFEAFEATDFEVTFLAIVSPF